MLHYGNARTCQASPSSMDACLYVGLGLGGSFLGGWTAGMVVCASGSPSEESSDSDTEVFLTAFVLVPVLPPRPLPLPRFPRLPLADDRSAMLLSLGFLLFFGLSSSPPSLSLSDTLPEDDEDAVLRACCLRKSDTTCCNLLLAYACRLRGAPAPVGTSKNVFKFPWRLTLPA